MKIAVDAMGGDNAPKAIIEGINIAKKEHPELEFLLFGKADAIRQYLSDDKNVTIIHTDEKIESDDEPVKSIRKKKQASMVLAAQAVKDGQADAIFSAGNTGALLAAGLFIVGRIKQIERPGLMTTLPVLSDKMPGFDMLDLGANADNEAKHIEQFAILGSFYAKNVRGIKNPTVGLLNNGTEASKGSKLTKATFELLSNNSAINFIGNVESRDILTGVADVVVTDGFTGNAVLKSIEGTAGGIMSLLKSAIKDEGLKGKLGALMLKEGLMTMKNQMDYSNAGGAVLFGLKAPVVKTHGSTEAKAVAVTITQIKKMLSTNVVGQLTEYFASIESEK